MRKTFHRAVLGSLASLFFSLAISHMSFASGSWTSGTFAFDKKQVAEVEQQGCTNQNVRIGGVLSQTVTKVCVFERLHWRYGTYAEVSGPYYDRHYTTYLVVGVGSDIGMYKVTNLSLNSFVDVPGSDDLLYSYLTMGFTNNHNLEVIRNLPSRLVRQMSGGEVVYTLKDDSYQPLIPDENGAAITTGAVGSSANGQWLGIEVMGLGLVEMNTKTNELRLFSNYQHMYGVGMDAHITFVISDDGRYVGTFDYNIQPKVYTLSDSCAVTAMAFEDLSARAQNYQSCPDDNGQLQNVLQAQFGASQARAVAAQKFNYDGDTLYFTQTEFHSEDDITTYKLPLHAGNYQPSNDLEYLALGDSYSSGEGDTSGLSGPHHYVVGTDEAGPPAEMCHISTRSYPYLLAQKQSIPTSEWQTVACSGAKIQDDYYGSNNSYKGQGGRLQDLTEQNRADKMSEALDKFIPGRDKQIEFVKKYQPRSLTITGSGNDAGFASILKACVSPFNTEDSCDYANSPHGKYMLAEGIKQQYDNIRTLIRALKNASPDTNIYYVGYPQFITSGKNKCGGFVSLSKEERSVFRDGVTYLNDIIEAAAKSEGAIYVDIENVLGENGEHELCGSKSAYVNGFNLDCSDTAFISFFAGKDDCQEAFHPNAEAHKLIASTINSKINLVDSNICALNTCQFDVSLSEVPVPQVFRDAYTQEFNVNYVPVPGGNELAAQKGNATGKVAVEVPYLEPGSQAHVYMASTPTDIGDYTVDNAGTLHLVFAVPDSIPAGYHTLHIETNTYSGEKIDKWWIVRVFGTKGDIDEDGVPDQKDACEFMPTQGIDLDNDNIDDGCDTSSEIGLSQADEDSSSRAMGNISVSSFGKSNDKRDVSDNKGKNSNKNSQHQQDTTLASVSMSIASKNAPVVLVVVVSISILLFIIMLLLRHKAHASKEQQLK